MGEQVLRVAAPGVGFRVLPLSAIEDGELHVTQGVEVVGQLEGMLPSKSPEREEDDAVIISSLPSIELRDIRYPWIRVQKKQMDGDHSYQLHLAPNTEYEVWLIDLDGRRHRLSNVSIGDNQRQALRHRTDEVIQDEE